MMDDFESQFGQLLDRIDLRDWNSVLALVSFQPGDAELKKREFKNAKAIEFPVTLMNVKGEIAFYSLPGASADNELLFLIPAEEQPVIDLGKSIGVLRDTTVMKSKKGGVSFSGTFKGISFAVLSDSDEQAPLYKVSGVMLRRTAFEK